MKLIKKRGIAIRVHTYEESFDEWDQIKQSRDLYMETTVFPESINDHDLEDHAKNMLASARDSLSANPIEDANT